MQFLPVLALAAVAATQTSAALTRSDAVLVRRVVDGDTIEVATVGRVRLLGIEAPAVGRGDAAAAPLAREARDRLAALVLHRWVRLEQESPTRDAYNRRRAYVVREDGVFVNAVLVREGLARISARLPLVRLTELQSAEREAQASRRGLWGRTPPRSPANDGGTRRKVASNGPDRYTAKSESSRKARRSRPTDSR
jgi:endonuclease YncB( thermonuclease family)